MTPSEIFNRISQLSGKDIPYVIQFCKNNLIPATVLNKFYVQYQRFPNADECAKIRDSGASYFKTI